MATVGSVIINLALNTAGVTGGLATVEKQFAAFEAQVSGVAAGSIAGSSAATQLAAAQVRLAGATDAAAIAQTRLIELQTAGTASAGALMSAQARVRATTVQLTQAQAALAAAQVKANAPARGGFPLISSAIGLASLAIVAFGDISAKAAAKFEYDMRLIQTQAGATAREVDKLAEGALRLAPSVQAGPDKLAQGLFHIRSVGIQGAQALDVLKIAAQGAAVGNADLETVTNALVAVVKSGIGGVDDMSSAMGTLNGIVGTGNLRLQDLSASFSSGVLSTAKQFGLSLQDVGAAIATMADQGIPAEEAATRLRITIALIGAPTKVAAEQLAHIGLTQRSLADEMRGPNGLIGALTLLKGRMDAAGLDAVEQSQLLKTAFGGSRSSAGILTLINSLELMGAKLGVIKEKAGSFAADFAAESQTAEAKFRSFGAVLEVLKVRLGQSLLPVVNVLVMALGFVAQQTEILIPIFGVLTASITFAAGKALVGLIAQSVAFAGVVAGHLLASLAAIAARMGLVSTSSIAAALAQRLLATSSTTVAVAEGAAATAAAGAAAGQTIVGVTAAAAAPAVATSAAAANGEAIALGLIPAPAAAAATGIAGVGVAATVATPAVGRLAAMVAVAMLPLTLIAVAVTLVALNFDKLKFTVLSIALLFEMAALSFSKFVVDILSGIPVIGEAFKKLSRDLESAKNGVGQDMRTLIDEYNGKVDEGAVTPESIAAMIASSKAKAEAEFQDLSLTLIQLWGTSLAGVQGAAESAGAADMLAYSKGIVEAQNAPVEALKNLRSVVATSISPATEIARLTGMLASQELADGLASGDPAVVAAAEAMKKGIVERFDEITNHAYTESQKWKDIIAAGLSGFSGDTYDTEGRRDQLMAVNAARRGNEDWQKIAPTPAAVTQAMKDLNAELAKTEDSAAASALSSAFSEIRSQAHAYFDELHRLNQRAIDDAVRQKNAILDAKEALNQAPVTAAQKALDQQRRQIQEWRLRQAVATAQDPAAQRDAILALQDFMAQAHVDDMQSEVDAAKAVIDAQKKTNEDRASAQKNAEDERYRLKQAAFDRDLKLLEDSLLSQKISWQEGQGAVLELLGKYGVTYGNIGSTLGETFSLNLKDSISAGLEAVRKLLATADLAGGMTPEDAALAKSLGYAGVGPQGYPGNTTVGWVSPTSTPTRAPIPQPGGVVRPGTFATGAWNILADQLAMIHRGEMVVPSDVASLMRDVVGGGTFSGSPWRTMARGATPTPASRGGGGTVVFKVGEEKLAELTDRSLSVQDSIYGSRELNFSGQR